MNTDDAPLESLLEHADWVRRLAESLLLDQDQVDDVVQQTWLAAMERTPRRVATPRGWLAGVVRNVALQMSRTETRRRAAIPQVSFDASGVEARANEHLDVHRRLLAAVDTLDDGDRSLVVMRYFEARTPREMAQELGLPTTTVRNRLSRALGRLRSRLDREAGGRRAWSLALVSFLTGFDGGNVQAATAAASAGFTASAGRSTSTAVRGFLRHPAAAAVLAALAVVTVARWVADDSGETVLRDDVAFHVGETGEDRPRRRVGAVSPSPRPAPDPAKVLIPSPTRTEAPRVRGSIRDGLGVPVSGALIRVEDDSDGCAVALDEMSKFDRRSGGRLTWTATSDDEGRFDVEVDKAGVYRLIATASGYSHAVEKIGELAAGVIREVDCEVHPVAQIRCVVQDDAGRPLPGVKVNVHTPQGWVADHSRLLQERRVTDANGEFAFDLQQNQVTDVRDLAWDAITGGLVASRQSITLEKRGHVTRTIDRFGGLMTDESGRIIIPMARGRDITFTFRPSSGEPLGGPIQFLAKLDTSRILRRGVTDANGRVTIEDLPETRVARFVVESEEWVVDYPDGSWIGTAPSQAGLPVAIPLTGDGHAVVPLGRGATIRGRAIDAIGRAVAGIRLLVSPHGGNLGAPSHLRSAVTAEDGTFTVSGVVPGRTGIFCSDGAWVVVPEETGRGASETGHRAGRVMEVRVGRTYQVVLEMARSAALRGRVVDTDGDPVPGAAVSLADRDGLLSGWPPRLHTLLQGPETACNDDGNFLLEGVAPGLDVELMLRDTGHRPTRCDAVTLSAGETFDVGDVAAREGAEVRITVRDPDGLAVRDLDVVVSVGREYRFYERRDDVLSKTDESGRVVVRSMPPGKARIALGDVRRFGLSVPPDFSADVTIPESGVLELTVDLVRPLFVEGRVVDENGDPLVGLHVHIEPIEHDAFDVQRLHSIVAKATHFEGEGLRRGARFVASRRSRTSMTGTFRVAVDRERDYRIICYEMSDGKARVRRAVGNNRARAGGGPVVLVAGARDAPRIEKKALSEE